MSDPQSRVMGGLCRLIQERNAREDLDRAQKAAWGSGPWTVPRGFGGGALPALSQESRWGWWEGHDTVCPVSQGAAATEQEV